MKRSTLLPTLLLTSLAFAPGCSGSGSPGLKEQFPFRDAWRTVIDQDFPHLAGDGTAEITSLIIGGTESNDNFANRGDIIVNFNGQEGRIKVEFRRFTFAESADVAKEEFSKFDVWAYSSSGSPKPPKPEDAGSSSQWADEDENCVTKGWTSGCRILAYYDGLIQPGRLGTDIRVTLPPTYRQGLDVITQDNVAEDAYQDRGNVCIDGARLADLSVSMGSGRVYVIAADDITPGPACSQADIEACENYTDPGDNSPAAWDPNCPCQSLGQAKVKSLDAEAANITIDIPGNLWSSMNLENADDPSNAAKCTAEIDPSLSPNLDDATADKPYQTRGEINHPSPAAIENGGYNIQAVSERCDSVFFTEDPDDYQGPDATEEQETELRGNIQVCNRCLAGKTCGDLMPWTQ